VITPNWLTSHLPKAERLVDSMTIGDVLAHEWVEALLLEQSGGPGRRRELTTRTLFVAFQLMVMDGEFYLKDVPALLDSLSPRSRVRLGLPRTGPTVTERQVGYLFGIINDALRRNFTEDNLRNDERFADFDQLFSAIAIAGAHAASNSSLSISVDGSDIATWGKSHKVHQRVMETGPNGELVPVMVDGHVEYQRVKVSSDPDATWRGSRDVDGKKSHFGYTLTAAVSTRDENGSDVPRAVVAARFRPMNFHDREMGLACIGEVAMRRGQLGDVLVDRGYTNSMDGKDFLSLVRAMGGEPVFDLTVHQVGSRPPVLGAVIIDGRPYSPSLPQRLYKISPPHGKDDGSYKPSPEALRKYQEQIAEREQWALVPHGSRRPNGVQVFMCPAVAGKLTCPLQQPTRGIRRGALPVLNAPTNPQPGTVCTNRYSSFTMDELPLYQRYVYGSAQWKASYNRRGTSVEPYFGALKDAAGSGLSRGRIRVTGIVKTGLLVAFAAAATNERLARAFDARPPVTATRAHRTGRPRVNNLGVYRQKVIDAADSKTVVLTT